MLHNIKCSTVNFVVEIMIVWTAKWISASFEQVNFLDNFQGGQKNYQRPIQNQFPNKGQDKFLKPQANLQNDLYASTYNLGWRNHLNLSYKNQEPTPPRFQAPQEKRVT